MSKNKLTDGLRLMPNGTTWSRAEIISGKRRFFYDKEPAEVWRKRDEAKEAARSKKAQLDAGPLFNEVAEAYQRRVDAMKHGTQISYLPAIKCACGFFAGRRMREIEPYMISEYLHTLSGMARTTVSNYKTVINNIFQVWVESTVWRGEQNTAKLVSLPRGLKRGKHLPPTDEQVQIVKDHYLEADAFPAVAFLCTGERRGEACAIRLQDIDFDAGIINITQSVEIISNRPHLKDTKTDAGVRQVPLLPMLREALDPIRSMPMETYILSKRDTPWSLTEYDNRWATFWHRFGMAHEVHETEKRTRNGKEYTVNRTRWRADVVAHQFRHEYVCMLCMAGVSEAETVQLVGHANTKMIHEVYMALKPQMVKDAGDKLAAFLKQK